MRVCRAIGPLVTYFSHKKFNFDYIWQVERLLELHFKYLDRVRTVDDQIEREKTVRLSDFVFNTHVQLHISRQGSKLNKTEIQQL